MKSQRINRLLLWCSISRLILPGDANNCEATANCTPPGPPGDANPDPTPVGESMYDIESNDRSPPRKYSFRVCLLGGITDSGPIRTVSPACIDTPGLISLICSPPTGEIATHHTAAAVRLHDKH